MPAQPIGQAGAFTDDLVAVVVQRPDLERLLVQVRDRERVNAFPERRASDRGGIDRIGLSRLAHGPPGGLSQSRRDPDHSLPAGHKPALQPPGHVPAILKRPNALGVELGREP